MNKDNKKLTELYNIIQEAFEPGTSPESNVSGPAKEFFNALKEIADKTTAKIITTSKSPSIDKTYNDLDSIINKILSNAVNDAYGLFLYLYDGDPEAGMDNIDGEEIPIAPALGRDAIRSMYYIIIDSLILSLKKLTTYSTALKTLYNSLKVEIERLDADVLEQMIRK